MSIQQQEPNIQQRIYNLEQQRQRITADRAAKEQAERDELAFLEQSEREIAELRAKQAKQLFEQRVSGAAPLVEENRAAVETLQRMMRDRDLPGSLVAYGQVDHTFNELKRYNETAIGTVYGVIDAEAAAANNDPHNFNAPFAQMNLTGTYFRRLDWGIAAAPVVIAAIAQESDPLRRRIAIGIGLALTGQVFNPGQEYDAAKVTNQALYSEIVRGGH